MKKELSPKYDSTSVEQGKYQYWLDHRAFESGDLSKKPFCIVIPPPNVTGKLHLGHAWDGTLQDMIIRYKKMRGYDTLFLPGMDHAGIATQAKIDARLKSKGISRYDLGREKFLEVAWEWKAEYATFIREQWAKLGLSLDYRKERFTLDEGLSNAVKQVFVTLYKKGLIYQGERIINFDPVQKTALSNIEVIYKEEKSKMYYFEYRFDDGSGEYLEVATTRPETMFADVCVVVNPKDDRYTQYVGKFVINPSNQERIPVIADEYVEIGFGTGAMKCTPAHDPNDFIIGEKYGFPKPKCMNDDATMNELALEYMGMDRFECRAALVKNLQEKGLLVKIEERINQVGHSERSDAIVEPTLSKQWFVKMKPLAEAALAMQDSSDSIAFFPERFNKVFTQWLDILEDWCISRQLWWGHRIPVYYHKETGEIYVELDPPADIENYVQDEDVLDTWFSSALWPFTTLGWPENTIDFTRYYPTDVLITGYDIIFFWVARMVFQGIEFTGKKPFKNVLIHGLIRDSEGRKMSKSLGNGVDPIDVIHQYGADALRYFLTTNSTPGQDLRYQEEKMESSWNFINKVWNAARFVLFNLGDDFHYEGVDLSKASTIDKWILHRLNQTVKNVNENMDKFEFVNVGTDLYNFIWDDFCSWYIELSKVALQQNEEQRKVTQNVLYTTLESIIILLHPFIPFVSEELYHGLCDDEEPLVKHPWVEVKEEYTFKDEVETMDAILAIVKATRALRSEENIAPNKPLDVYLRVTNPKLREALQANRIYLEKFTHSEQLVIEEEVATIQDAKTYLFKDIEMFIPLSNIIDKEAQKAALIKEIAKLENEIKRCEMMLSNPNFVQKAPAKKIEEEKAKLQDYQDRYEKAKALLNQ